LCVPWDVCHDESNDELDWLEDPILFAESSNPDILHLTDAMRAQDADKFCVAIKEEVDSHTNNEHWVVISKSSVPKGTKILPAVWAFRRKRRIATQEVHRWKACSNAHGGRQELGVNCWEMHAPAAGWSTICLFLNKMTLNKWVSMQVDFVLAFPPADVECNICMEIPAGGHLHASRKTQCLQLKKNLHGQKQADRVWNQHMHGRPLARGFAESEADMCACFGKSTVPMICTDDGTFMAPDQSQIDECLALLTKSIMHPKTGINHSAFKMTDEGEVDDCLGIKIQELANGTIKLLQPRLINQIINDVGFNERTKTQPTPASPSTKLNRDIHSLLFEETWNC